MASQSWLSRPRLVGLFACSIVGCNGSSGNPGFASDGTPVAPPGAGDSGSATIGSDGTAPQSDGSRGGVTNDGTLSGDGAPTPVDDSAAPPTLFVNDSAPVRSMSDCKPGTYTGTYAMMAGPAEAGSLFSYAMSGTLSITLVANQSTPHPGEFNNSTLTVAPGAQMTGADKTTGSTFSADLSGQLDCISRMFVGTLSNGLWLFFGSDAASVMLTGSLSATYDPNAKPLAFVNGSLDFSSPQIQGVAGVGQWTATLQ